MKKYDAIIVGQGLCGTFLSYYMIAAGKRVMVIDNAKTDTASKVASGVINPVTGRRIVRTWRIEELLPFALDAYIKISDNLEIDIVKETSVLDFHPSLQMKEAFDKRPDEEQEYLHKNDDSSWKQYFSYNHGVGEVSPCLLIDINTLLNNWRERLIQLHALSDDELNIDQVLMNDKVSYKDITADKIIFCDGVAGVNNPFFKNLPYAPNKGEALLVKIPGLPADNIYKQGISIVPWKDDLFWVGSTYQWTFEDDKPTEAFKTKMINQLNFWLKLPFEVVEHLASVRPANIERRPFVGLHPNNNKVGILNGMGTKGCSLAPFFAKQLAEHLISGSAIYPDADVKRFEKVLNRALDK